MQNISFSSKDDLKLFFRDKRFQKILIICGKFSFKNSGAEKIIKEVLKNKETSIFYKKLSFPEFSELIQIIEIIKEQTPDLIIAIGGGSVIDYAKISNVLVNSQNIKSKIINSSFKIKKKYAYLAAIPTTAGSGAEVTSNAVIYVDGIKYSIESKELKPDIFFFNS